MIGLNKNEWYMSDATLSMVEHHPKQKSNQDGGFLCMVMLLSSVEVVTEWMEVYCVFVYKSIHYYHTHELLSKLNRELAGV